MNIEDLVVGDKVRVSVISHNTQRILFADVEEIDGVDVTVNTGSERIIVSAEAVLWRNLRPDEIEKDPPIEIPVNSSTLSSDVRYAKKPEKVTKRKVM